jgi:hypothetical protein
MMTSAWTLDQIHNTLLENRIKHHYQNEVCRDCLSRFCRSLVCATQLEETAGANTPSTVAVAYPQKGVIKAIEKGEEKLLGGLGGKKHHHKKHHKHHGGGGGSKLSGPPPGL